MNRGKSVPERYSTILPDLAVSDVIAALAWYHDALGAEETFRLTTPGGKIAHVEMIIGDSNFVVSEENPEWHKRSPRLLSGTSVRLGLFVDDVDAVMAKATAAGAKHLHGPEDQFYGHREGMVEDPFGHIWMV